MDEKLALNTTRWKILPTTAASPRLPSRCTPRQVSPQWRQPPHSPTCCCTPGQKSWAAGDATPIWHRSAGNVTEAPSTVQIKPADCAFATSGCWSWQQVG